MSHQSMPDAKTIFSTAASLAASAVLIRSFANELVPGQVQSYLLSTFNSLSRCLSSQLTIVIEEFHGLHPNQVFEAVNTYLGTKLTPSTRRIKLSKAENEKNLAVTLDRDEEVGDEFENVTVRWRFICTQLESSNNGYQGDSIAPPRTEFRSYELTFHKKHKQKVLDAYIPYIVERFKAIKDESKAVKLHTVYYRNWDTRVLTLDHPMTFDTLGIDSRLKKSLIEDLDSFISRKDYYRRIGKAWKRGYLLYGPPGTGKSSLVAAMANYLNFDIYDLDLTDVLTNTDLRFLLLGMSSKSILVIEDIDCGINLDKRDSERAVTNTQNAGGASRSNQNQVTLSGLLNFVDGLWSSWVDGQIIVFTTNHKDRLDPALLRPGRMDLHIEMSFCNFSAFKQLASNYLGICEHQFFEQVERLLREVEVTPAEVAGELMKSTNPDLALHGLINYLENKQCKEIETQTRTESEAQEKTEGTD